jgi:2-polyprenyl-6-hydroxyphenyl methylase/3-demethylubiquinone-9 3-methyltransferase
MTTDPHHQPRPAAASRPTITVAEDLMRLLPRGTHGPTMFIKPRKRRHALQNAGLAPGPATGLEPRGLNRRLDPTFGPLPLTTILYMRIARKPSLVLGGPAC